MRSAVFASAEENDRIMNKRSYTIRVICAAVMKGNAAMLKTYRNQTALREDIPPGTVYYPASSRSQLPQGQPPAIRSSRLSDPSPQVRLIQIMAHSFLQDLLSPLSKNSSTTYYPLPSSTCMMK